MWWDIRKAVDVKDWEQYSVRWKNGMGKRTNHSGRHWGGFHMFGPTKKALRWSHWRGAKLVKDATKKLFFSLAELKNCETLEPVSWSRGRLRWKVILVSFLCIYNKCAFFFFFFEKCLYFLTYHHIFVGNTARHSTAEIQRCILAFSCCSLSILHFMVFIPFLGIAHSSFDALSMKSERRSFLSTAALDDCR
jgi:hypothetical protein